MRDLWTHGYVKICGVTNVVDALAAVDAGANAIGVIFAASPRRVNVDQAQEILDTTRGSLLRCGVFRENSDDDVLKHTRLLDFDIVQLHGPISDRLRGALRERPTRIVKALNIEDDEFASFNERTVDAVMIDGPRPGSGVTHSWDRLETRSFNVPVIASGGLDAHNVADVVRTTRAWGVDSSSGVESNPGTKDADLIKLFVAHARGAWAQVGE
ncbi:MAG: phosphoribosylanthranilate isomerase [Acidimicrobiales bacterium]